MAFYKLFKLIHHRTDWYRLWRFEREIMMPEWYIEKEALAEKAVRQLALYSRLINNAYNKSNKDNFFNGGF